MSDRRRVLFILLLLCILCLAGMLYWGIGPTLTCAFPSNDTSNPGRSVHTIETSGGQRCFLLYIPETPEANQPLPLIINLHGFSSNPHGQQFFSNLNSAAGNSSAVVVYPQGTGFPQRWNADPSFSRGGADDVGFIRELIDHLTTQLRIDRQRIFVSGFSNGGAMTLRLACELSDQIAAISTVSAPVSSALLACQPERPVALIAFHGTRDPIVPYAGRGRDEWVLPFFRQGHMPTPTLTATELWVEQWAAYNLCSLPPSQQSQGDAIERVHYSDCSQDAEVILYTVVDGGHTWPGGRPIPFVGMTSRDLSASELMVTFFMEHPLPSASHTEDEE